MRFRKYLGAVWLLFGCAGAASRPATTPTPIAAVSGRASEANAVTQPAAQGPKALPELLKEFEAAHLTGTIALFDTQDGVLGCSDVKKCQEAVTPASTFKIPHSLIALETGVVEGPDTVLPWDHQQYSNDDWNQDLKFRDAFRLSCLPCYR